ncbi:diguanylate cyclase [Eleftheria terrae]|uniref:diguanylate cyclase n=1 Tax=Eleftheria terrae TaxID=1597781 RepID=UPI00263B36DD|nr:diguanylate cyclase [Eleftheria terrae]WKB55866.1 diguanylate cyclase [Eleftheria terrae]
MELEKRLKLGFLTAAAVVVMTSAVPFHTARVAREGERLLERSHEREELFVGVLSMMQDAETGQRGFLITGNEDFLEPYHRGLVRLQQARPALARELGASPENKALGQWIDLKLRLMADAIALRRRSGFDAVQPVIAAGRGKQSMDQIRALLGQLAGREAERRRVLLAELQHSSDVNAYAVLVVALLDAALLLFLMVMLSRALRDRRLANEALRASQEQLSDGLAELQRRNAEISLVGQMTRALDAPVSREEMFEMIGLYGARLLPRSCGRLYAFRNSRDRLERQATWGDCVEAPPTLEPHDCWALRRGQPHRNDDPGSLPCLHHRSRDGEAEETMLCIPLIAQGEVLGLLSLVGAQPGHRFEVSETALAMTVAEQVSLSLSNLGLREALRQQSIIDPLTGLYNRRYLDETLKREFSRAARRQQPLSVIVLDVDHFKQVNDRHGHDAGDAVLRALAQRLKGMVRGSDVACRYGGEEFVLLLPDCKKEDAAQRAHALLEAVRSMEVWLDGGQLGLVSASFGVASCPEDATEAQPLLQRADQALYRAKREGRSRVVLAGRDGGPPAPFAEGPPERGPTGPDPA